MKRNLSLKPREIGNLPPEKLHSILSRIYPEETVDELMDHLIKNPNAEKVTSQEE